MEGTQTQETSPTALASFGISPLPLSSGAAQVYCDDWHILQGKSQRKLSSVMNRGKCYLYLVTKKPKTVESEQPFVTGALGPCALTSTEACLLPSRPNKGTCIQISKISLGNKSKRVLALRIITCNHPKDRQQLKSQDSFRLSAAPQFFSQCCLTLANSEVKRQFKA